jgi:hypothetical protein
MALGTASTQPLSVLAKREQRGSQNEWATYVELFPEKGQGLTAVFGVRVPADADPASQLKVLINFLGENREAQAWDYVLRAAGSSDGVVVGGNGKKAWKWSLSTSTIGWPDGLVPGADAEVVISSASDLDVADVDYIAIEFAVGDDAGGATGKRRRRQGRRRRRRRRNNPASTSSASAGITATTATAAATTTVAATTTSQPSGSALTPGVTWYWQLQGTLDTSIHVGVYDIDMFDTPTSTISGLKAQGRTVVCYFSAGSYEEWRSDAADFDSDLLGDPLDGWPGERWLDIRDIQQSDSRIAAIMRARLDLAQHKGCHAVEPDNIDGYQNNVRVGRPSTTRISCSWPTRSPSSTAPHPPHSRAPFLPHRTDSA